MNTLVKSSSRMPFHTDLRIVFEAFGGREREFNWMLTDLELNFYPPGLEYISIDETGRWLTGSELSDIVNTHEIQFIWGVLSGFRPAFESDIPWVTWRLSVGMPEPLYS